MMMNLDELNDILDNHDVDSYVNRKTIHHLYDSVVVNASMDELDEVYSEWDDHVNMTASELERWSGNPCSRQASKDPSAVIKRNLRLLTKNKEDWTTDDIEDAKRTISFISRMSDEENEPDEPRDGPHGCPSEWAISLLNWAYNPFDSLPETPDNDDLEEVDKITMSQDETTLSSRKVHMPNFTGTTDGEWNSPNLNDFTDEGWSDLSPMDKVEVSNHFVGSTSGFPPENYTDLFLPVVDPEGNLNLNGLRMAKSMVNRVEGISESGTKEAATVINTLATNNFDSTNFTPVTEMSDDDNQGVELSDGTTLCSECAQYITEKLEDVDLAKHGPEDDADEDEEDDQEYQEADYEFTPVPDQVLYADRERAMSRADDLGLEGVHTHTLDGEEMYMPGDVHENWVEAVRGEVENSDSKELQDWSMHEPEWSSTADQEWNKPNLEDFVDDSWDDLTQDEKSDIADYFVLAAGGFPPENFGDLALPVVEPDGTLNLNALANAKARANQVEGLSDDMVMDVKELLTRLANDNFDDADFETVENAQHAYSEGDKVRWESSGGTAMGVVRDRTMDECYDASIDGDVKVCGEEDNPAYLIEVFDDDEGELTGTMVAHKEDTLESADFEMSAADSGEAEKVVEEGEVVENAEDERKAYVLKPNVVQQVDTKKQN